MLVNDTLPYQQGEVTALIMRAHTQNDNLVVGLKVWYKRGGCQTYAILPVLFTASGVSDEGVQTICDTLRNNSVVRVLELNSMPGPHFVIFFGLLNSQQAGNFDSNSC